MDFHIFTISHITLIRNQQILIFQEMISSTQIAVKDSRSDSYITSYHSLLRSDSLGLGFLNRDISGSDLKVELVESRSRILNEGLGISAGLGFYHSIPLNISIQISLWWPNYLYQLC